MASLSGRGTASQLLPLSAIVALTPIQLVANFPVVLDTIQRHHLLHPPSATSSTTSTALSSAPYARFLTKCLGLISQGQRVSNPSEQWCGLQLLRALVRQSSPAALTPHYQHITLTVTELQKQAGYAGDVLDLPLLESMVAVLCSAAEAGGEVRREIMTTHLNRTVGVVVDRIIALLPAASSPPSPAATTSTSLRRLLVVLDDLLSVYVASLRSFSSRLQPLLTSLLLHCDDSCLPPLLNCLTTLLVSMTAAAASQHSNKAKQARMQQAAQDTTDEVAQQKLTTSSSAQPASPYHAFATACVQQMTAAVDELRLAMGEQAVSGSGEVRGEGSGGLGWEAVMGEGVLRGLEVVRRHERLCAVMAALISPQLPAVVTASSVELSVPLLPLLHVLCGSLGVEPYASSGNSTVETALTPTVALLVLPSLYDSSLRLLESLLQHCHHALLPFVYPLLALIVDVHRRCSTTPALEHLLPAVYRSLASFVRLPLSPSLLATLSGNCLALLLSHVQQPFVLRRELAMQQVSQSMASQLKPAASHSSRRSAHASAASASSSTASELSGEQQLVREDVATGALLCLQGLLEAGSLLPLSARTTIDSTLLLLTMSLASSTSHSSLPMPATIRVPLQRCVIAALMHPPAASLSAFTSPLLPYVLPLLRRGTLKDDGDESSVCRDGLLLCEWLTRERPGVTIGRRRKADRMLDLKEGDDEEAHLLDALDEWSGGTQSPRGAAAVMSTDTIKNAKRRRAMDKGERTGEQQRVGSLHAPLDRARQQMESAQRMDETNDHQEEQESKQLSTQRSEEEQRQDETTAEHSDESEVEAEEEKEAQPEEHSEDEEEEEEGAEEKTRIVEVEEKQTQASSTSSTSHDNVDDDDFGAVLHVDDDLDEG